MKSNEQTLMQLKYQLMKQSQKLSQKEKIISIVMHDLKSPLRFLSMHMKNLQKNLKEMNQEEFNQYSLLLKNTVNETYLFTREVLFWLNNENDEIVIVKKEINIEEIIQESTKLYYDICIARNNLIKTVIPNNIIVNTSPDLLKIIIRNIIDDANKFTKNGTINITAGLKEKLAYITITDSGIGMTQDKINELITYESNNWDINANGKHLGYRIINDLILKLNGSIKIQSELKKGTSVTVFLPVA